MNETRVVDVPLRQARNFFRQDDRFWKLYQENPQEAARVAQLATSTGDTVYNFDKAVNANPLLRARNWLSEQTGELVHDYVEFPLKNTFGDNTATRILSNAAYGIADSAPELAAMIATRGRYAPTLAKYLGTLGAGYGAMTNNYAQTGDTTSAIANGILTAATPTGIHVGQRLTAPVVRSLSPNLQAATSFGIGGAVGLGTNLVGESLNPEMVDAGGFAVSNEKPGGVSILDIARHGSRLYDTITNPEIMGTMLLSEVGPGILGATMHSTQNARAANARYRTRQAAFGNETPIVSEQLRNANFDVPLGIPESSQIQLLQRFGIEGSKSFVDIQRQLYSLAKDKLTAEQKARYQALLGNPELVENLSTTEAQAFREDNLNPVFMGLQDAFADLDPNYNPTAKGGLLNQFGDALVKSVFHTPYAVETHPLANRVYNLLARSKVNQDRAVNDVTTRLGLDEVGNYGVNEAQQSAHDFLTKIEQDKSFAEKVGRFFADNQNKLFDTITNEDGTTTQVRRNVFNQTAEMSIDDIMSTYNVDRHNAVIMKNISYEAFNQATDTMKRIQFEQDFAIANNLFNRIPNMRNKSEALIPASDINRYAHRLAMEYLRRPKGEVDSPLDKSSQLREAAIVDLANYINDNAFKKFGLDPSLQSADSAYVMADSIFSGALANVSQYARNAMVGYAPAVRRGKYKIAWTDPDGERQFVGYEKQSDYEKRMSELSRDPNVKNLRGDSGNDPYFNAREMSFDSIKELRRELLSSRSRLEKRISELKLSDSDSALMDALLDIRRYIDEDYDNVAKLASQRGLLDTTTLRRQNVKGINNTDYIKNLVEYAELNSRINQQRRTKAEIDFLMSDPSIRNNKELSDYLQKKIDYMGNQNTQEFRAFRSAASLFHLSGTLAFLFQNLMQVPTLSTFNWRQHTGRSLVDYALSAPKASKLIYDYDHRTGKSVNDIRYKLMARAEKDKVFDQVYTEETYGRRQIKRDLVDITQGTTITKKFFNSLDRLTDWASQIITASEILNRKWAFATYLESENNQRPLSRRSTREINEVYNKARAYSDAVNFTGGKASRPAWIQSLSNNAIAHEGTLTSMALMNYGLNVSAILFRALRQLIPGLQSDKTIASKAYKNNRDRLALVKAFAVFGALAGYYGLPGSKQMEALSTAFGGEKTRFSTNIREGLGELVDYLAEDDDDPDTKEQRNMFVQVMMYGLPAILGVHQQNIGNNSLIPFDFDGQSTILEAFGAPGQLMSDIYTGLQAAKIGDWETTKNVVTPASIRAIRNYMSVLSKGTMYNRQGDAIVPEGTISNPFAGLATIVGGRPVEVQDAMYGTMYANQSAREITEKQSAYSKMLRGLVNRPDKLREAISYGIDNNLLQINTDSDVESLYKNLASSVLSKRARRIKNETTVNSESMQRIFSAFNIDPQYETPVETTLEAVKIAKSLGDYPIASKMLAAITDEQRLADRYIKEYGVPPVYARILAKKKKTDDDIKRLNSFLGASTQENTSL